MVEVRGLVAVYGAETVLDGVDFTAEQGLITVILGGSGCGKSTLLRNALGLMRPAAGEVRLFGRPLGAMGEAELKAIRARIGVLFQGGALFSSMTVGENVAMAIRETSSVPEPVIAQIVRMKLAQVGMEDAITKYPEELSGGMRKRAALARAIAIDPEILFCDEPSAGLDPIVAAGLDELLLHLKALYGITMVVVTHDLDSVRKIADKVVMLDAGHVLARGTLAEVEASEHPIVRDYFARIPSVGREGARSLRSIMEGVDR